MANSKKNDSKTKVKAPEGFKLIHLVGGVGVHPSAFIGYNYTPDDEDIDNTELEILIAQTDSITLTGADAKAAYLQLLSL